MTNYKLNYFNTRGQGEAVRFLLAFGQIPFVDHRVTISEWQQIKHGVPFGKLPTLEVDSHVGYQTLALCRYLGRKCGLGGRSDLEAAEIDSVAETIKDLYIRLTDVYNCVSCEEKEKLREHLIAETLPFYLGRLDEVVVGNGGYFVGGQLSWADLLFAAGFEGYNIVAQIDVISKYENLCLLNDKVRSLPSIQLWLERRPFSAF